MRVITIDLSGQWEIKFLKNKFDVYFIQKFSWFTKEEMFEIFE